jgi:hypothetical protein
VPIARPLASRTPDATVERLRMLALSSRELPIERLILRQLIDVHLPPQPLTA